jgi:uracil-DNA glycosylase
LPAWSLSGNHPELGSWVEELFELERRGQLCPPLNQVWHALECTAPEEVRVVLLGQDPYHGMRQAHGLAFSVADPLLPWPPSLRNVFKERASDLGLPLERSANLQDWADQGVLMLNAVLTTQMGKAGAHAGKGWEEVVAAVLREAMAQNERLVWILWGRPAEALHRRVLGEVGGGRSQDVCLASAHPSPLSAHRGYWGSRPFSRTNEVLQGWGQPLVVW